MPRQLEKAQEIFWNFITSPEGVEAASSLYPQIQLEKWFEGDAALPTTRRLDIYANMYFWRIHDAVKEDYPRVATLLGDAGWNNLMTDYLLAHPSATPFLQYAGRHLPDFLKEHPFAKEYPFLSDLARLEWERAMLFEAEESPYLSPADLKNIPAEKWPSLRLTLVPAFKILDLEWNIDATPPVRQTTVLRLWRKDFVVYHATVEAEEKKALSLLQAGAPFEKICETLPSAEKAAHTLAIWIDCGLIAIPPEKK